MATKQGGTTTRTLRSAGVAAFMLAVAVGALLPVMVPRDARAADSPAVSQALQDIERYEGLAAAMVPGDKATGRKYMSELSAVAARLRTAPGSDPRLPGAVERFNALQKRVVETANAPAAAGPPRRAPAAAAPTPSAPAGPSRLTSSDQAKLNRLGGNIRSLSQRIEAAGLQTLLDERQVAGLRTSIANNRTELAGYPADAAGVADAGRELDTVAAKLEARLGEAKAKGAALGDVEAQLAAIDARIRGQEVPTPQAFKPEAGPDAAAALVKALVAIKAASVADLAVLEKLAAAGIKDQRIDRLRHWAGAERQRRADDTLRSVSQGTEAQVERGLQHVAFHAATDPNQADHRANRLIGEGRRASALAEFDRGLAAVATAAAIDGALGRKDAPDRAQQKQALAAARAAYEEKFRLALGLARMPPAGMTDAKYLAIARETLANPSYGVAAPKRLVINSKQVSRREKKEAEIRPGTVSTTATIYHWVWDEFQVTTAEAVGDEHYLFHNTLKFFLQGAPTTPTNRWVLSGRFQGERILPENIDK